MSSFSKLAAFVALAGLVVGTAWSQQSTTGQAGQQGSNAQQRQQNTGQANSAYPGGTPIYQNPDIRRNLNITDQQLKQLNQAYGDVQGRYKDPFSGLDRLDASQRAARAQELSRNMNADLMKAYGGIFNDQQMNRFRQLDLQNRGFTAFSDPNVQKQLNLTDKQLAGIQRFSQQYNQQLQDITKSAGTNRDDAVRRYDTFRKDMQQRLNDILTPEQRKAWSQMTGDPYNFRPDFEQRR
jgi:hypothetical protein